MIQIHSKVKKIERNIIEIRRDLHKHPELAFQEFRTSKIIKNGTCDPYLSMGGEDFSYYGQKNPSSFFFIGSLPKNKKTMSVPHHYSHFDIEKRFLLVGSSIFVTLIEDLLF